MEARPHADVVAAANFTEEQRKGRAVELPLEDLAFVTEDSLVELLSPEALNSGNLVDIFQRREEDFMPRSILDVTYLSPDGRMVQEKLFVDDHLPNERPRICISSGAVRATHRAIAILTRKVDNLTLTLKSCRQHYYKELFFLRHGRPATEEHEAYWFNPKAYEDNVTKQLVMQRITGARSGLEQMLEEKEKEILRLTLQLSDSMRDEHVSHLKDLVHKVPVEQLFFILKSAFAETEHEAEFYSCLERFAATRDTNPAPEAPQLQLAEETPVQESDCAVEGRTDDSTYGKWMLERLGLESQVEQLTERLADAEGENLKLCVEIRDVLERVQSLEQAIDNRGCAVRDAVTDNSSPTVESQPGSGQPVCEPDVFESSADRQTALRRPSDEERTYKRSPSLASCSRRVSRRSPSPNESYSSASGRCRSQSSADHASRRSHSEASREASSGALRMARTSFLSVADCDVNTLCALNQMLESKVAESEQKARKWEEESKAKDAYIRLQASNPPATGRSTFKGAVRKVIHVNYVGGPIPERILSPDHGRVLVKRQTSRRNTRESRASSATSAPQDDGGSSASQRLSRELVSRRLSGNRLKGRASRSPGRLRLTTEITDDLSRNPPVSAVRVTPSERQSPLSAAAFKSLALSAAKEGFPGTGLDDLASASSSPGSTPTNTLRSPADEDPAPSETYIPMDEFEQVAVALLERPVRSATNLETAAACGEPRGHFEATVDPQEAACGLMSGALESRNCTTGGALAELDNNSEGSASPSGTLGGSFGRESHGFALGRRADGSPEHHELPGGCTPTRLLPFRDGSPRRSSAGVTSPASASNGPISRSSAYHFHEVQPAVERGRAGPTGYLRKDDSVSDPSLKRGHISNKSEPLSPKSGGTASSTMRAIGLRFPSSPGSDSSAHSSRLGGGSRPASATSSARRGDGGRISPLPFDAQRSDKDAASQTTVGVNSGGWTVSEDMPLTEASLARHAEASSHLLSWCLSFINSQDPFILSSVYEDLGRLEEQLRRKAGPDAELPPQSYPGKRASGAIKSLGGALRRLKTMRSGDRGSDKDQNARGYTPDSVYGHNKTGKDSVTTVSSTAASTVGTNTASCCIPGSRAGRPISAPRLETTRRSSSKPSCKPLPSSRPGTASSNYCLEVPSRPSTAERLSRVTVRSAWDVRLSADAYDVARSTSVSPSGWVQTPSSSTRTGTPLDRPPEEYDYPNIARFGCEAAEDGCAAAMAVLAKRAGTPLCTEQGAFERPRRPEQSWRSQTARGGESNRNALTILRSTVPSLGGRPPLPRESAQPGLELFSDPSALPAIARA